jgi:TolB-like protein
VNNRISHWALIVYFLSFTPYIEAQNSLDNHNNKLVEQIVNSMREAGKTKTAVIEFSDLNGNTNDFGKFLAEELITKLFLTKKFEVIERQLLNKIITEHKLNLSGLIDPNSAKELGKILGVDAIISGTITDLGDAIKVNARLISTETGQIFSVASEEYIKDNTVKKLMGVYITGESKAKNTNTNTSGDIFFKEDFSNYEIGDIASDWGKNVVVQKSVSNEYYIQNQAGVVTLTHDIKFPKNFSFEFDFWGYTGGMGESFVLVDKEGKELLIRIDAAPYADIIELEGIRSNRLSKGEWSSVSNDRGWNTIKIVSNNSVFKIYLNSVFAVSGSFPQYTSFVRIKYTVKEKRNLKNFIGRML